MQGGAHRIFNLSHLVNTWLFTERDRIQKKKYNYNSIKDDKVGAGIRH
jgi:hypothetical protein